MSTHKYQVLYIYPRRVDFQQLIEDIVGTGMSYFGIARAMGVSWSTLQKWRKGSEPRHSTGSALLGLHRQICGTEINQQRITEAEEI